MSNHRNDVEDYAAMFKALSNPHRLTIFRQLMEQCCSAGPCCESPQNEASWHVSEISGCCDVAPSTLSHHLKELRIAGLLRMEKQGKYVDCWVEPDVLIKLSRFFQLYDDPHEE